MANSPSEIDNDDLDLSFEHFRSGVLDHSGVDGTGTPLHVELAELRTRGIVSSFGISKNLELFEQCKQRPSTSYTKSPELFLQCHDDDDNEDDWYADSANCVQLSANYSRCDNDQKAYHANNNDAAPSTSSFSSETIFETVNNEHSAINHFLNFIEPNTSFHSVNGYDNEQLMFEGIIYRFIVFGRVFFFLFHTLIVFDILE
jgi:hypothetical protein